MLQQLSAVAVLGMGGCERGNSSKVVHMATTAGLNLTMSELLRQQGFLESFDLTPNVLTMADGTKILSGIYSGSIDLAPMSGFGPLFPAVEHGADIKIINASTLVPLLALFSGRPAIRALKDLEGKIVGVGALGALDHQLTVTLLRKYSVDISTVRFVNIGSNTDVFRSVMAGTVDAGTGPAAFFDVARDYKVHGLENGNMSIELKEFTYQAGWTSNRVIQAKRDVLVRVLAAYAKLFRFVQQPSAQAAFVQARKTVLPNAPAREHLLEWQFLQHTKPFSTDLMMSPERVSYMQQIGIAFNVQKVQLPYDRVADMSLARDALKLVG